MAEKDYSGSKYFTGKKKKATKTATPTPSKYSGSKYAVTDAKPDWAANLEANAKSGKLQKDTAKAFDDFRNQQQAKSREKAGSKAALSTSNAVLNTLNTTSAWVAGAADNAIKQTQAGKGFDIGGALDAGNVNANAWKTVGKTIAWKDILVDRFGWDSKNALTDVAGFAGDVLFDPLNFAGKPLSFGLKMAKATAKAADAGVDAIKLFNNGEQSINSIAAKQKIASDTSAAVSKLTDTEKARLSPAQIENLSTEAGRIDALEALGKKVTPAISARIQNASPIPANLSKLPGAAGEKGAEAARKLADEYTYKTITVTPDAAKATSFVDNFKGATAAALEASTKQLKASILSDNAAAFMAKYAKRDKTMTLEVPTGKIVPRLTSTLKTSVSKQGDEWVVRSGNKVTLASAATKQEAEAIAKKLKSGESASLTSRATMASLMGDAVDEPTTIDVMSVEPTTPQASAITSILKNIQKTVTKIDDATDKIGNAKKYTSLEDVIDGLRVGDNISTTSLRDIIAALDPEKRSLALAIKADNAGGTDYMAELLMNKGLDSLENLKAKLKEAESFKQVARLKGLGYTEEVDAYLKAISDPAGLTDAQQTAMLKASGIDNPAESQTVEAAAGRWAQSSDRTKNITETAVADALALRNKRLDVILASDEASRDISSLGDLVDFSSAMRLSDDSLAVLAEDLNNVFVKDLFVKAFNFRRADVVRTANAAENSRTYVYNPAKPIGSPAKIAAEHKKFAERIIDNVIKDGDAFDDYLLTMGKRINNSKFADDKDFAKAYKKYGVNYSAADQKHTVYVTPNNIFKIFNETGAGDLIQDAFVPLGDPKSDAFLMLNFLDATRNSMEQAGKGVAINQKEIATRLLTRIKSINKPSATRKAEMRILADRIAAHLATPEVQNALKEVHLKKVFGIINDYAGKTSKVATDIFDTSRRLWLAKTSEQTISEFQKIEIASKTMREFFYASDIFKNDAGPVAETMFKSYATMLLNGLDLDKRVTEELMRAELQMFTNQLQQYGKYAAPVKAANAAGREGRTATPKQMRSAERKYVEAETAYVNHVGAYDEILASGDAAALTEWTARKAKLQNKLNPLRENAYSKGIGTRHWDAETKTMVPAEYYDFDKAAASVEGEIVDQVALDVPAGYLIKRTPAPSKQEQIAINRAQIDLQIQRYEDAASETEKLYNAGVFKEGAADEVEEAIRAYQHMQVTALQKGTSLPPIQITTSNYLANKRELYNPNITPAEKAIIATNSQGDPARMSKQAIRESRNKWQQRGSLQEDQIQYVHANHIGVMSLSSEYASYLSDIAKKRKNTSALAMDQVWDALKAGKAPKSTNLEVVNVYNEIKPIYEMLVGTKENNVLIANGIELNDVLEQFGKSGLSNVPTKTTSAGQSMQEVMERMPMGTNPNKKGTIAYDEFERNKAAFAKSNFSQFDIFSRFAYSVGVVKFKKGLMEDFFVNNSYKALGYETLQAAIDSGRFITPQLKGMDSNAFAKYIPTPENGGLVLPEAWESFGAAIREAEAMFNDPLGPKLRAIMNIQGFLKANQTLLVPGFQFTTFFGDAMINATQGVVNGAHYGLAGRLTKLGAAEDISKKSMFVSYENKLEAKLRTINGLENSKAQAWEGSDAKVVRNPATNMYEVKDVNGNKLGSYIREEDAKVAAIDKGGNQTTAFIIYKNGKPTRVKFSDKDLYDLMKSKGIIIDNIYAANIQGLEDQLTLQEGSSTKATVMRKIGARLDQGYTSLLKTPGDVLAWQGNITRVAQAAKVMQSRGWASMDDALNAAAREVQLYHPTIQSLASSERKYGRAAISYYTWLRMATLATVDMAMKNPALVTLPSKFQYSVSGALGNSPQNIGSAYEEDAQSPSYMTGKAVGINVSNAEGSYIIKPPFLQPSALDAFSFMWDTNKSVMDNLWTGAGYNLTNIAGMGNQVIKLGVEILQNRDEFGRPTRDTGDQIVDTIVSNFSVNQLAKGLGIYTPENKRPENTQTPITDKERQIALFNWLTRAGLQEYNTAPQIKRYNQEQKQYVKKMTMEEYLDSLGQE